MLPRSVRSATRLASSSTFPASPSRINDSVAGTSTSPSHAERQHLARFWLQIEMTEQPTPEPVAEPKKPFNDWPYDKTYIGKALPREGGGWEIRILRRTNPDGPETELVGLTECATLERLEEKAWDFVRALTDDKNVRVIAAPDIGDALMMCVIGAWKAMRDAKEAEAQAARRIREVVRDLRERAVRDRHRFPGPHLAWPGIATPHLSSRRQQQ